jgi:protocatechuate 3,4-dioxygenase beta subunit
MSRPNVRPQMPSPSISAGPDMHERGLAVDLAAILERRRFLKLAGFAIAGGTLSACDAFGPPGHSEANWIAKSADGSTCLAGPGETNGPFPADGTNSISGRTINVLDATGVERADLRTSFAGLSGDAAGAHLSMELKLVDVAKACAPLGGHAVYVWHCDAGGRYSLYEVTDRNYLRGVGVTDAQGMVRFTSIFPGCYGGRWPHIHFEIFAGRAAAASGRGALLTSQFAIPKAPAEALYAMHTDYKGSLANLGGQSIASDNVFGDNTPEQIAAQTMTFTGDATAGFRATATVGIVTKV